MCLHFYVGSVGHDVGEALALYVRYSRIVNEAFRLKLTRGSDHLALEMEFVGLPRYVAQAQHRVWVRRA
jgi:hypothetical protein